MDYRVPDHIHEPLYVITPVFNAPRWRSRWKHYHRFAKFVKDSGGTLVTIEAAFGERAFAIPVDETPSAHAHPGVNGRSPIHIRVRTNSLIWHKERMLNLAIARLPADWKYAAIVDADVIFARPNWVSETVHALQTHKWLQLFSIAQDVDPNYTHIGQARKGFVQGLLDGFYKFPGDGRYYGKRGATGLAWAFRRDAFDAVGGLLDIAILGSGDWHMLHALFGKGQKSYPEGLSSDYRRRIADWQYLAEKHIRHDVGVVSGTLLHFWHGKKINRKYADRWKVLIDNDFSPSRDLKVDYQGMYTLEDHGDARSIALREGIRKYFAERNEDSIDV